MPFSVRLDEETERAIEDLAERSGRSRAAIVREAVAQYAASQEGDMTAYDRLQPLIGIVRSRRGDLSRHTGRKVAELLKQQRPTRARRSR